MFQAIWDVKANLLAGYDYLCTLKFDVKRLLVVPLFRVFLLLALTLFLFVI